MLRTLRRTDPRWGQLSDLERQIDLLFGQTHATAPSNPAIYAQWSEGALDLVAEVPGLGPVDIEVTATADTLTIKGERKLTTPAQSQDLRRERTSFRIDRTLQLRDAIDPNTVTATVRNGLLTVSAPLAGSIEPKQIQVKASEGTS